VKKKSNAGLHADFFLSGCSVLRMRKEIVDFFFGERSLELTRSSPQRPARRVTLEPTLDSEQNISNHSIVDFFFGPGREPLGNHGVIKRRSTLLLAYNDQQ
jgi:hypothetical protein